VGGIDALLDLIKHVRSAPLRDTTPLEPITTTPPNIMRSLSRAVRDITEGGGTPADDDIDLESEDKDEKTLKSVTGHIDPPYTVIAEACKPRSYDPFTRCYRCALSFKRAKGVVGCAVQEGCVAKPEECTQFLPTHLTKE
jgi:hypothetical protein